MDPASCTIFYSFEGFEKDLLEELHRHHVGIRQHQGRLLITDRTHLRPVWAQAIGSEATEIQFQSISEAARALVGRGGHRWACASTDLHRRSQLIQEQVSRPRPHRELAFLGPLPQEAFGLWALVDATTLIAAKTSTPVGFPLGEVSFTPSPEPPSRAYLKLWELFTVHHVMPPPGARVIDLGGAPGGWTWVLAKQGCFVTAVDRAALAPQVAALPKIRTLKQDAFKVTMAETGPVDWLFSDLICYPARLLELIHQWRGEGVKNMVCTIKFQGKTDFDVVDDFLKIPGSWVVHLCANKHEITWVLTENAQKSGLSTT